MNLEGIAIWFDLVLHGFRSSLVGECTVWVQRRVVIKKVDDKQYH